MEHKTCDVLIIGGGGAALYAAIHAHDSNPSLKIVVASKGLMGKSGCTRMVQGGYNAVMHPDDSFDMHYDDTLRGGGLINNQELAWILVNDAPERIYELENSYGCFFDRHPDGTIHQRALAGQSYNRTVHRTDLTGIELMSRLSEQVLARENIEVLNEVRGVDLMFDDTGKRVCGALLLAHQSGELIAVNSKAVLLATGGAAPLYRLCAASLEKSGDGLAMAFRAGAEFVDMEMMQFHPTGLIAGKSVMTGTVLEEGLRGAGGHLLNVEGERYMKRYDPNKMERSTRDRVSRSGFLEIRAGRGTPEGGLFLDVRHLGKEFLLKSSPGMYKRCLSVGYDMATDLIQVTPTAHFQMGGVRIDPRCRTSIEGLFAAGEDAGGVHGANRLGGNGVAESMVFGAIAGDAIAEFANGATLTKPDRTHLESISAPFAKGAEGNVNAFTLRAELGQLAWEHLGIIRSTDSLNRTAAELNRMEEAIANIPVPANRASNAMLQERMNVENLICVARLIHAGASLRKESRGSHYREDFIETRDEFLVNIFLQKQDDDTIGSDIRPVVFSRRKPADLQGETKIPVAAAKTSSALFTSEL